MVTVKELKEMLATLPDDYQVVISKDGEGNGFSPLEDYSIGRYEPETTWCGEWLQDEDLLDEDDDGNGIKHVENAICLWPVN